ncbi:MAG TPA: hypothetical protein VH277_05110 [Gemmatimonadaceae bacterium]|nr:hypothetical protein [Gemmatimonadaceae bacterium]
MRLRGLLSVASLVTSVAVALSFGTRVAGAPMVAVSPGLFEYHSAFWVNLHHFLYEQARARGGFDKGRAIVAEASADTSDIATLSADERRGYDRALAYYAAHLAPHDLLDRGMARIKAALGDADGAPSLERDFHIRWPNFLIRVDASAYSSWAGAYTTVYPDRITIATRDSDYSGTHALSGLEMLFHESLHTLDDSLSAAFSAAAARHDKQMPRDVVHAMIFFTTGVAMRHEVPEYRPYAYRLGIWQRGTFVQYLPILREAWEPFLEGKGTFPEAIDRVAALLP